MRHFTEKMYFPVFMWGATFMKYSMRVTAKSNSPSLPHPPPGVRQWLNEYRKLTECNLEMV